MNNKPETNQLVRRFENVDIFLKNLFKLAKPQTDAMTEKQRRERFLKSIMDLGKTNQEK